MAGKTWLAILLSLMVWFAWIKWFAPTPPPRPTTESPVAESTQGIKATDQSPVSAQQKTPAVPSSNPFALPFGRSELETRRTKSLEVAFTNAGGKLWQAKVLAYKETMKPDSDFISVVDPQVNPLAFGGLFTDEKLMPFSNEPYEFRTSREKVLQYVRSAGGVTVTKEYKLDEASYFVDAKFHVRFDGTRQREWGYLLIPVGGGSYHYDASQPMEAWEVVSYQNDSVRREAYKDIGSGDEIAQGTTRWLSFGNRYFATVLVNESEINPDVVYASKEGFVGGYLRYPLVLKPDSNEVTVSLKFFMGPKDVDHLSVVPGLKKLINYGMFSVLAYPLLALMRFFYSVIHNWGVAIILLTVLVRLLFYPLSVKSYRGMKAMQKLQPQIKALKEKHKNDMQKFNQEQMALFKAHKVNPMSGCLPILVQIPVFFALYSVLSNSIELFHTPFFGWIADLSAKDPYYIFPILMGISMFIQQKMTPTAGMDPTQAKIMMLMPIVFTFIMLSLPSGLTIYIFVSTVLGIVQQLAINREPGKAMGKVVVAHQEGSTK